MYYRNVPLMIYAKTSLQKLLGEKFLMLLITFIKEHNLHIVQYYIHFMQVSLCKCSMGDIKSHPVIVRSEVFWQICTFTYALLHPSDHIDTT